MAKHSMGLSMDEVYRRMVIEAKASEAYETRKRGESVTAWGRRARGKLLQVLGIDGKPKKKPPVRIVEQVQCDGYTRRRGYMIAADELAVPFYLLSPDPKPRGKVGLCLAIHGHGPGKVIPVGMGTDEEGRPLRTQGQRDYAVQAVKRGWIAIAPDLRGFGELMFRHTWAVVIGRKPGAWAATMETCAFPNLGYETEHFLGPGEITFINEEGMEQKKAPGDRLQICSFLWVYYGYPASHYEKINVEATRYRCGVALANKENREIDVVAGIPDSGTSYAIGFANQAGIPYCRPFVKYTPTWPRSFMPQDQTVRDLVAKMKLIPIRELIEDRRLLFCEDSIVRGTQLQDNIQRLYDYGAKEVHMRPACPPLIHGCKFLNFSRSRSELDLAGRRALSELEGDETKVPPEYSDASSDKFKAMVDRVSDRLRLTSLRYQELGDMVNAIGLPKEKLCTYCWDGVE